MTNQISEKIIKLIQEIADIDKKIMLDSNLIEDYYFDSLMFMQLLIDLENEYEISFDYEELDYNAIAQVKYLCNLTLNKVEENRKVK